MSDTHIEVRDPDDPHGMPAYDGPADRAGDVLAPGTYKARTDDGHKVKVKVARDGSTKIRKA